MRKHRLYHVGELHVGQEIVLSTTNSDKIINVLRLKTARQIILFNNTGFDFVAEITATARRRVSAIIQEQQHVLTESPLNIHLGQVLTKGQKMDFLLQKATELGVSKIIPVITERTITKNLNLKRMQDIAIESSEQCERITIPEVCAVKKLKDLIPNWDNDRIIFFCDETIRNNDFAKIDFQNISTKSFGAILVGPEGGFSTNETNYLREKKFIRPIDLGPRILRSDTAVIAALSLWHCLNGDIKSN